MSSILIIDDDVAAAKLLEFVLARAGHDVEVARDVASGRKALEAGRPDLVILDVFLPDGSGLDLIRGMRLDLERSIPAIVLSGHRQEEFSTRASGAGATAYMNKPFSPRALVAEVDRLTAKADVATIR
jgi:two-component system, NtrC family, nitrogen regulation response regulator NtrX